MKPGTLLSDAIGFCAPQPENAYVGLPSDQIKDHLKQWERIVGRQTQHTIRHVLAFMLKCLWPTMQHVNPFFQARFLMNGETHGLDRILRGLNEDSGGSTKEAFKQAIITDGLCSGDDDESAVAAADGLVAEIERRSDKGEWPSLANLAEEYVGIWMHVFTKTIWGAIKEMFGIWPSLLGTDRDVNLAMIKEMDLIAFQRIWRKCTNKMYDDKNPTSFIMDLDSPKVPHLAKNWGRGGNTWKTIDDCEGLPYKKRVGNGSSLNKNPLALYPSALLDFLWILFYAHLSPECHAAITELVTSTTAADRFPQQLSDVSDTGIGKKARRYLRCLVLTISASAHSSHEYWNPGFFVRERRGKMSPVRNSRKGQILVLLISAIRRSCPFFVAIGLNPKQPEIENGNQDQQALQKAVEGGWALGSLILKDHVVAITVAFAIHVYQHNLERISERKATKRDIVTHNNDPKVFRMWLSNLLDESLRATWSCPFTVNTGTANDDNNKAFLSCYSIGGEDSLTMSPDLIKMEQELGYQPTTDTEPAPFLVEVLGRGADGTGVTHRIDEFSRHPIDWAPMVGMFPKLGDGDGVGGGGSGVDQVGGGAGDDDCSDVGSDIGGGDESAASAAMTLATLATTNKNAVAAVPVPVPVPAACKGGTQKTNKRKVDQKASRPRAKKRKPLASIGAWFAEVVMNLTDDKIEETDSDKEILQEFRTKSKEDQSLHIITFMKLVKEFQDKHMHKFRDSETGKPSAKPPQARGKLLGQTLPSGKQGSGSSSESSSSSSGSQEEVTAEGSGVKEVVGNNMTDSSSKEDDGDKSDSDDLDDGEVVDSNVISASDSVVVNSFKTFHGR